MSEHFMGKIKTCFFDSSALTKLFKKNENGHEKVKEIFSSEVQIYISAISVGEVLNVLKSKLERLYAKESIYDFLAYLRGGNINILDLKKDNLHFDLLQAEEFMKKYGIEATDALHLLIMISHMKMLEGESKPFVVCSDKKLCVAFESEGYKIINPEA